MSGLINRNTLVAALAVQLVIVGALLAGRSGAVTEPEPFLDFDAERVDSLAVSNADGAVRLVKADGEWRFENGLPASADKVQTILDKLADASGGWPVATSAATAERFEVTEDSHQRRVTLMAGDETLADVYLGTSPGYRKTHARLAEGGDVYSIAFANYEARVKAADWLDRSLLRPAGDPTAVRRVGVFEVTKGEDGQWSSADAEALDQSKVETLAGRFTGLSALDFSDAALPESPTMVYVLADDEGEQTLTIHRILKPADEELEGIEGIDNEPQEAYIATSDRVAGVFEISSYIAEQMDVTIDDLVPEPPEAEEEAPPGDGEEDAGDGTDAAPDAAPRGEDVEDAP